MGVDREARIATAWRALAPRTRALCLFFLPNGLALNLVLAVLPWTPEHKTGLNYSARALLAI